MLESIKNSKFIKKIGESIQGFIDFRVILLIGLALLFGYFFDPKATVGLIHFCVYIFGVWGLALLVGKIFRIGDTSEQRECAVKEKCVASGLVYFSNTIFRIAVAISVILWWKSF